MTWLTVFLPARSDAGQQVELGSVLAAGLVIGVLVVAFALEEPNGH